MFMGPYVWLLDLLLYELFIEVPHGDDGHLLWMVEPWWNLGRTCINRWLRACAIASFKASLKALLVELPQSLGGDASDDLFFPHRLRN